MELNTRSILIKGMDMPKHCWQCRLKDGDDICILLDDDCMNIWGEQNRLPNCPLIELPDHGDLIDRDDLRKQIPPEELASRFAIENAEVVIPAER